MSDKVKKNPKWREDFPFESEGDEFISRRDFIRFLGLVSAGLAVGNGYLLAKSLTVEEVVDHPRKLIVSAEEMEPGSWRTFNYPDEDTAAVLVRQRNGEFVAFHQKCPHLACPVVYERDNEEFGECFTCHCHNGRFDCESGRGVAGPPRELRPLRRIALQVEADGIYAVGVEKHHHA
jgi:nitrite reductase/ring-hydroxylating ferredoxin subunit